MNKILLNSFCFILIATKFDAAKDGKKRYQKFTNIECYGYNDYVRNVSCSINDINLYKSGFSGKALIVRKVDVNDENKLTGHIKTFRKSKYKWNPWFFDISHDICDVFSYLDGSSNVLIYDIILAAMKQVSTANHTCPYGPNELFETKNLTLEDLPVHMKSTFPRGTYRVDINFTVTKSKKKYADSIIYIIIGEQ